MMSFLKRAENGRNRAAMPCHSRGMAWHGPATTPATGYFGASGSLKNMASQGSDTLELPKCQFWQLNQRLALIAALLRKVWNKSEAPGPKPAFLGTR